MGALWGVGGLTFGLAIRYLGIALGYAIALGLCTAFGTLIPPIYDGSIHTIMHETSGQIILRASLLCLIAVAVNGLAGCRRSGKSRRRKRPRRESRISRLAKALRSRCLPGS